MALTSRELKIYEQAKAADAAFQRELVRVYKGRAGDMRYRPQSWTDARIKHAATRHQRASDRWIKAFRAANARTVNPLKRGGPRKGKIPPHLRPYLFKKGHR
jgi:hypothetical protein